ncbi:putative BOI-related E3 ubiquitin-protein ligase 3 [Nicotiana tabacum]|uniref:BOI-related E3 ubiquitin-protein ligase 3 n=2 Tax=Nicotiana TaxID=4085 RepID=A0A1S4BAH4_TOBAC|nr:PREDICTED: probable BOI-related E3 ubiquitin-protein ligase 3 [Nicotiana sylvestris]XP_016485818.1 PREDICTED: probable BOI-related E3 ubiquitin-protein ligase 3 [Nicotiana tabacum]
MAIQAQLYTDNFGFPFGGSQDLMENGCGFNQFSFSPQQQQHLQQNFQQQSFLQILPQKNNQNLMNIVPKQYNNGTESMPFSQCIASQFEKQSIEIDQFISLQNERLRLVLNEQRKQQLALIWRKYEAKVQFLLKQKDEEIAKAVNRKKELEEFLQKMEIENQTWQKIAQENEAIVISLNNTIEQLRENGVYCLTSANGAEDAESCCDFGHENEEENGEDDQTRKMKCKSCNSRKMCMIFLPCRHLSTCKDCDSFLNQCPVCGIAKKASIEALI